MTFLRKKTTLLLVGAMFVLAGCSQPRQAVDNQPPPQVSLSCIGVTPVIPAAESDKDGSFDNARELKDGVEVLDMLLHKELAGRGDIRFVNQAQIAGMEGDGPENALAQARRIATFSSCNGVLNMQLLRYRDRVGGPYTAKDPASVAFTYRLIEVNSGTVLCQGRYDETQESVMENLYNLTSASKRGFTWVTAEELLREGLRDKFSECSYLRPAE